MTARVTRIAAAALALGAAEFAIVSALIGGWSGGVAGWLVALGGPILSWLGPLLLVDALQALAGRARGALRRLLRAAAAAVLAGMLLLLGCGWFYFVKTAGFVSQDLLRFFLPNAGQVVLHFLQSFPLLFLAGVAAAVVVGAGLRALLARLPAGGRVGQGAGLVGLVLVLIAVLLHQSGAARLRHPLLAILKRQAQAELSPQGVAALKATLPLRTPYQGAVPAERPPVIVLMVESLRRDVIDGPAPAAPALRALAAESTVFERAYITASQSSLADLSIWYAQYPLRAQDDYPADAPWRGVSSFQAFKAAGYHTGYISSQNERWGDMIRWLDVPEVDHFFHSEDYHGQTWRNPDDAGEVAGLFARGVATAGKIEDSETLRIAEAWLDTLPPGEPFFLGMNLQNTHFNYVIPPGGAEPFQPSVIDFPTVYYVWPEDRVTDVRNRYRNAVYNLDALIAAFIAGLQRRGIWERCYFVVLGDSGEAFYEHGFGNHSGPLYDEVARPLTLLHAPRDRAPLPGDPVMSQIDLLPTIMAEIGIPIPDTMQGLPLHEAAADPQIFMVVKAMVNQTAVVQWPWKLMVTTHPERPPELYHLEADPAEQVDRARDEPGEVARLKAALERWQLVQRAYYADPALHTAHAPPRWHSAATAGDGVP